MSNEKEGLAVNSISSSLGSFSCKTPAIMITERSGAIEKVIEFATAEDYAAYKRIEAEALMTDKYKSVNVNIDNMGKEKAKEIVKIVQSAVDSAELRIKRCDYAHVHGKGKI